MTEHLGARLLIVEDEPDVADFIRIRLEREGYDVRTASDGKSAIDTTREWLPHLVLMDLRMSPMDGFEVMRSLQEDERTTDIPILVVSIVEAEERVRLEGARGFLLKPFQPEGLINAVQDILTGS